MIQLFINGKLVDYGTKKDISFYVRLGYDVKVLGPEEAENYRYKMKIKTVWDKLPMVLRKRVAFLIRNQKISWVERFKAMTRLLQTIMKRVKGFNLVSALHKGKQSIIDKILEVLVELVSFLASQNPAQYALANA
jgi:hypothetical protein